MFEKFVTYHLNPKAYNLNRKKFFEDIYISDIIEVDKFIPRKNEKIKKKIKKASLKKGTYLFTQKIINGKVLDILIVIIDDDNNAKIIEIQITIHKPNEKLFDRPYLQKCSDSLIETMNKLYDFKIETKNIFFVYIFDKSFEQKNKKKFKDMLFTCDMNKIPCLLFEPVEVNFYGEEGTIVKKLGENIICPYSPAYKRPVLSYDDDPDLKNIAKLFPPTKERMSFHNIQPFEEQLAIKVLKRDYGYQNKKISIKYKGKKFFETKDDFQENSIYVSKTYKTLKTYIIYYSKRVKVFKKVILDDTSTIENENTVDKNDYLFVFDEYEIIYED